MKKIALKTETVRKLDEDVLDRINGGKYGPDCNSTTRGQKCNTTCFHTG